VLIPVDLTGKNLPAVAMERLLKVAVLARTPVLPVK